MATAFYRRNAAWLATGLILALGSSFGQTFFISLFAGEIRAEFGLSDGDWGAIYTVATLGSAGLLMQAGRLADTMAVRRLTLTILLLYVGAIMLMAGAQSVWMLGLAVFGLRFCGQGMMSHISMTAMARWFRANRGRAVAVAVMGYPIGEAVLPVIFVTLIGALGWRQAYLVAAILLALVFLPLLMRLMADPRIPEGEGPAESATGIGGRHWTRTEVTRHWGFWALMPGVLANSFIGTVIFFHQAHIAETRGWDLGTMALGYPVFAAVSVTVAWIAGQIVDRTGPVTILPVYLVPMGAAAILLALPGEVWLWHAALALCAVTQGFAVTLLGTLWPTLYGTRHIGSIKAVATSAMVVSTAVGPGITGLVIDFGVDFQGQAGWMAAWCLGISAGFVWIGARLRREATPG